MSSSLDYTVDELMSVCIARQVIDGEVLAQGINTPLVMAGYILAKLTHAPRVRFASAIGQAICSDWAPLSVIHSEAMWLDKALYNVGFAAAALELLPKYNPKEFFRPAQVDARGNTNNIAFGRDHQRPRMRLPGCGGIPDVTPYSQQVYLYVPRHSPVTFVKQCDFISGVGYNDHNPISGPRYLISDLGQFDWANGHMRLTSVHPHATVEAIQKKTGFPLETADTLHETPPPTAQELHLLRSVIDPLGVRKLETLGGSARKSHLRHIIQQEMDASA